MAFHSTIFLTSIHRYMSTLRIYNIGPQFLKNMTASMAALRSKNNFVWTPTTSRTCSINSRWKTSYSILQPTIILHMRMFKKTCLCFRLYFWLENSNLSLRSLKIDRKIAKQNSSVHFHYAWCHVIWGIFVKKFL